MLNQSAARSAWRSFFVERIDRKSTRLNSSHSQISYAVFCLKKKKTHNRRDGTSITRIQLHFPETPRLGRPRIGTKTGQRPGLVISTSPSGVQTVVTSDRPLL